MAPSNLFPVRRGAVAIATASGARAMRKLNAEVDRLGHRPLQLRAAEALAEAALASGDAVEAEAAARSGLKAARDSGSYARAKRLQQLLDAAASRSAPAKTAALPPTGP